MPTRIALYRALAEAQYADEQDVIAGVATDHTTTTVKDTAELKYSSGDANTYDRRYVYLEAIKEHARVIEAGYAGSTGILTLSGTLTDAPAAVTGSAANVSTTATTLTDTDESMTVDEWAGYTIYAGGQTLDVTSNTATVLTGTGGWSEGGSGPGAVVWTVGTRYVISDDSPVFLRRVIGRILTNMYEPSFFPLSLHIMGNNANDMEASTVATDYSSTNATNATESTIIHNGAQSLKVTDSGSGGGYANTGNIGIPENKSLYAAIMCYVTSGDSATFRVIDVTDSNATIEDATTDEPSWMELVIPFSVPSGCEQIDLLMSGGTSGDVTYWEDIQVWRAGTGVYPVPSWLEWPEQIIDIRGFPQGTTGPASDKDYRANERASVHLNWHVERVDRRADVPFRIWVESTNMRPYIYAHRPFAELTAADSTSNADLDALVEDAAFIVLHPDRAEQYLSVLRQQRLGGATIVAPRRVGVR